MAKDGAKDGDWVCLGVIGRPHGVRGLLRIRPFTEDPEAVGDYGPLTDWATGRSYSVEVVNVAKGLVTARIEGVNDRDQAEALKGTELWVARAALPGIEDEEAYYHHDLIGLAAVDMDGAALGEVVAMQNYGAGDLMELRTADGRVVLVPFTREVVPEVDMANGRVVIAPPPGLFDEDGDDEKDDEKDVKEDGAES